MRNLKINKMEKFVNGVNSTEPKKTYGFNPVVTDNSVEQRLTPPIPPVKPVITKEDIQQTEKKFADQAKNVDPNAGMGSNAPYGSAEYQRWANQAYGGVEMTSNPVEWLIGGGAAKPAFNLFKNVTRRVADKVTRYAKSQLPKGAGEAGVDVTQNYFGK
jgi:hypothetical protein